MINRRAQWPIFLTLVWFILEPVRAFACVEDPEGLRYRMIQFGEHGGVAILAISTIVVIPLLSHLKKRYAPLAFILKGFLVLFALYVLLASGADTIGCATAISDH